jgi:DNA adenine methylase
VKAPFPWFGGKSRAAPLIWSRMGDPPNYVEPFAGSLAVILGRPGEGRRIETVNDIDGYVSNFWRALQHDPDGVAEAADNPVNECDLHARHTWLHAQVDRMERLKTDPDYYDSRVAGFWCWGLSSWIGDNFCRPNPQASIPHLGNAGLVVHRKRPHLGNAGQGINRQLPHLGDAGNDDAGACATARADITEYMRQLADRLRYVRVCCGDWRRVCTETPTAKLGITAVVLDPPYADDGKRDMVYGVHETGVWGDVCDWCRENGANPLLRIALCGYESESADPGLPGWDCVAWKAHGGMASQGKNEQHKANSHRERIWFSPACIDTTQPELW